MPNRGSPHEIATPPRGLANPHGPFFGRRALSLDSLPAGAVGLISYANVPRSIGTVVSHRLATLHELQTVYGMSDVLDFLEIIAIDACNERRVRTAGKR